MTWYWLGRIWAVWFVGGVWNGLVPELHEFAGVPLTYIIVTAAVYFAVVVLGDFEATLATDCLQSILNSNIYSGFYQTLLAY